MPVDFNNLTLAELKNCPFLPKPADLFFRVLTYSTYDEFASVVNDAMDVIVRQMEENPKLRQDHSEDEISIAIVEKLQLLTLDAEFEALAGGHCDIHVRSKSRQLWLGEAKKHAQSYAWIEQGFDQLDGRYANPGNGGSQGGILVYCFQKNAPAIMQKWKEHLTKRFGNAISFQPCPNLNGAFFSTHTNERTGTPFVIRHIPISLYFDPKV